MANPTLKATIPQAANVAFALWVSPDIVGGSGAWDAKTGVRYAPFGTLNSVALGTSGRNGLVSTAMNCGIQVGGANNHTGTPFDFSDNTWTILALIRPVNTAGSTAQIFQNRDAWSPGKGWYMNQAGTYIQSGVSTNAGAVSALGTSGAVAANTAYTFGVVFDTTSLKEYKNGATLGSATTHSATSIDYSGTANRIATLFNYDSSKGATAVPMEIYAVIGWNVALTQAEIQAFGTTEAALLAGDFYTTAFDFSGGVVDGNASGATISGTSSISAGAATGNGPVSASAPGATLAGTSGISPGSVSGGAGGTGSLTTDIMVNNTGSILASTAISWTWYQGSIGSAPTSLTHGSGTTNSGGVLTVTGLPSGSGFLIARTADGSGVYYQTGSIA